MRRSLAAIAALALALTIIAGCRRPGPPPPPAGGGLRQVVLDAGWGTASPYVQDRVLNVIIPRESGWDPCAFYPSRSDCSAWNPSTAKGLFQLLGHDDLIFAACPNPWGIIDWHNPHCNALAAWYLSGGGNLAPWGG